MVESTRTSAVPSRGRLRTPDYRTPLGKYSQDSHFRNRKTRSRRGIASARGTVLMLTTLFLALALGGPVSAPIAADTSKAPPRPAARPAPAAKPPAKAPAKPVGEPVLKRRHPQD